MMRARSSTRESRSARHSPEPEQVRPERQELPAPLTAQVPLPSEPDPKTEVPGPAARNPALERSPAPLSAESLPSRDAPPRAASTAAATQTPPPGEREATELDVLPGELATERSDALRQESVQRTQKLIRIEQRGAAALVILATIAIGATLHVARPILMPMTFALLLALTLRPIVRRLRRLQLPDSVASGLLLATVLVVAGLAFSNLIGPAQSWIETMPGQIGRIREKFAGLQEHLKFLSDTSTRFQEFADGDDSEQPVAVQVLPSRLSSHLALLSNTGNLIGSAILIFCMAFFLLAFGDRLLNNVLHLLNTWSEKKRTVELVYDVERGIASYLFTVTVINISLGVVIGFAMWLLGMPNPALWGGMATVFNYVPIFGAFLGTLIVAVVAVLSFDSLAYAALVPVTFAALTALEGNIITPSILGKSMSLNPILVFSSLIFWGWLWGVGGALLAVPLLAAIKLTCERFQKTQALATLMEA